MITHCTSTTTTSNATTTTTGTTIAMIIASVSMAEGTAGTELLVAVAAVGMTIIVVPKFTMVTGSMLTLVVTVCDSAVVVDSAVAIDSAVDVDSAVAVDENHKCMQSIYQAFISKKNAQRCENIVFKWKKNITEEFSLIVCILT